MWMVKQREDQKVEKRSDMREAKGQAAGVRANSSRRGGCAAVVCQVWEGWKQGGETKVGCSSAAVPALARLARPIPVEYQASSGMSAVAEYAPKRGGNGEEACGGPGLRVHSPVSIPSLMQRLHQPATC